MHLKLGDVLKLNGKFGDAVEDFNQCLQLRMGFMSPNDRGIADVHYSLAQATEYAAAEADVTPEQAESFRARSLRHYQACRTVFCVMVADVKAKGTTSEPKGKGRAVAGAVPGSGPGAAVTLSPSSGKNAAELAELAATLGLRSEDAVELAELQDIVDELTETIASLEDGSSRFDMSTVLPTGDAAHASSSQPEADEGTAGVTVIGFGQAAAPAPTTTVGFGGAGSTSSTQPAAAPLLMVKKKKKVALVPAPVPAPTAPTPTAPTPATEVATAAEEDGPAEDEPQAKKSKVEAPVL